MESNNLFGVFVIDQQKYALPLSFIKGIESTDEHEMIEDISHVRFQDALVPTFDMFPKQDKHVRHLAVILESSKPKAIQVDSFISSEVNSKEIKNLPSVMCNEQTLINNFYLNKEMDETTLVLHFGNLDKYLETVNV